MVLMPNPLGQTRRLAYHINSLASQDKNMA